jgi:hypothetical protein
MTEDDLDPLEYRDKDKLPDEVPDDIPEREDGLPNPWKNPANLPHPDKWEGSLKYDKNGREYNPYRGSSIRYQKLCGGVLSTTMDRYGEERYCTAIPKSHYNEDDIDRCHKHKQQTRENMKPAWKKLFKHGAFAKTIVNTYELLDGMERVETTELFDQLITQSSYDFECSREYIEFDLSDDDDVPFDAVRKEFPMPEKRLASAKALFRACVEMKKMDRINLQILEDGMEKETVIDTNEDGNPVTATDEHHLHLPLNRIKRSHQDNLEAGGVDLKQADKLEIENNVTGEYITDIQELDDDVESSTDNSFISSVDD